MTISELRSVIEDERKKGSSDEEIMTGFASMFYDGELPRGAFEAICGELGFELSDEAKEMDDEELKEHLFEKSEDEVEEGKNPDEEKVDPFGDNPPRADKSEKTEEVEETEKVEESDEDEEREAAGNLFGMDLSKKKKK